MYSNFCLADRYEYERPLGTGANGSVFSVIDKKLSKRWAVKLCTDISPSEIDALKTIDAYAFPRIVDVITEGEKNYIIMDYIEGVPLSEYILTHSLNEGEIIDIGIGIAKAISYLHSHTPTMLYMDCKPANIMITPLGDIRLIDLGSVFICSASTTQRISSTAFYAPDEIVHCKYGQRFTTAVDIYGIGMTMYHMITGERCEYRDTHGQLCVCARNKNISSSLENIIRHCTSPLPADRYLTAEELINDLESLKAGMRISPYRNSAKKFSMPSIKSAVYKGLLAASVILFASYVNQVFLPLNIAILTILFILFLNSLGQSEIHSAITNKSIVLSSVGPFLISCITVLFAGVFAPFHNEFCLQAFAAPSHQTATDEFNSTLPVTLYDEYGRKLLVKRGCAWDTSSDIRFSIPTDMLKPDFYTITISCESQDGTKIGSYSFNINNTKD